jgi:hypothetical protein
MPRPKQLRQEEIEERRVGTDVRNPRRGTSRGSKEKKINAAAAAMNTRRLDGAYRVHERVGQAEAISMRRKCEYTQDERLRDAEATKRLRANVQYR